MFTQDLLTQGTNVLITMRELLPRVLGAAALGGVGWILAGLFRRGSRRLARASVARMRGRLGGSGYVETAINLIGNFVFWLIFLVFVTAGVETLGLPVLTGTVSRFVYYLPNVLSAAMVMVAGLIVGDLAEGATTRALVGLGAEQAAAAGKLMRIAVIAVAMIVAIEEIGINGQLLVVLVAIVVGTGLAGAGLAFGLGARTAVSNIIAAHYLPSDYKVGRIIRIGTIEGRIVTTTPAAVVIATENAQVTVPASHFSENISFLVSEVPG